MNYSLIQVTSTKGNQVKGVWVQNHVGKTLESAIEHAVLTEQANGNKLDIAVIRENTTLTTLNPRCLGAERLDTRRITPRNDGYGQWADDWTDR